MTCDDDFKLLMQDPEAMQRVVESLAKTLEAEVTMCGLSDEINKVIAAIREDYRAARTAGLDTSPLREYHETKGRDHLMLLATAIGRERGKRWARK